MAKQMQWSKPPAMGLTPGARYQATIRTNRGDITVDLLADEAPKTVNNFVFLAREGYYAGVPFHRVIDGFMVQTGDPTGTGAGGPGYTFDDEPVRRRYTAGTLAMANRGKHTNGSQFFIMHRNYELPPSYTIFGLVTSGMEVVNAIATTPVKGGGRGESSSPVERQEIVSVTIVETPAAGTAQ